MLPKLLKQRDGNVPSWFRFNNNNNLFFSLLFIYSTINNHMFKDTFV